MSFKGGIRVGHGRYDREAQSAVEGSFRRSRRHRSVAADLLCNGFSTIGPVFNSRLIASQAGSALLRRQPRELLDNLSNLYFPLFSCAAAGPRSLSWFLGRLTPIKPQLPVSHHLTTRPPRRHRGKLSAERQTCCHGRPRFVPMHLPYRCITAACRCLPGRGRLW